MVVKRLNEPIPKPRSVFYRVKCPECGNEQVAFDRAGTIIKCNVCSAELGQPAGGKTKWKASVVSTLE
ncbi:MAG: 30S ribosomal protein S27e [Candidatus Bathyarchaeia archaeon]